MEKRSSDPAAPVSCCPCIPYTMEVPLYFKVCESWFLEAVSETEITHYETWEIPHGGEVTLSKGFEVYPPRTDGYNKQKGLM